jgi:hypothetical protein
LTAREQFFCSFSTSKRAKFYKKGSEFGIFFFYSEYQPPAGWESLGGAWFGM